MDVVAAGSGAGALLGRTLRDAVQMKSVLLHFNWTIVRVLPVRVAPLNPNDVLLIYSVVDQIVHDCNGKATRKGQKQQAIWIRTARNPSKKKEATKLVAARDGGGKRETKREEFENLNSAMREGQGSRHQGESEHWRRHSPECLQ